MNPFFTAAWRCLLGVGAMVLGCAGPACAQREANTWYFGERAGFDFRAGAAAPLLNGQLTTEYASAVASDSARGELRLYSNGARVWNRAHRVMPHGGALRGSPQPVQGALLLPAPGQPDRYYLFTLAEGTQGPPPALQGEGPCQLFYSLVDLRLDGGLGDVVAGAQDRPLDSHLTEKLTAVRHANGRDYWVLAHEWGSNAFLVYPLTPEGVGPARRQSLGPTHPAQLADTAAFRGLTGYLQASPDGRRLASAVAFGPEPFALFDFDAATGTVRNYRNLGVLRDAFGVCFSPDNTKLYVQNFSRVPDGTRFNVLSQYDLAAGNDAAVAASGRSVVVGNPATNVSVSETGVYYALQNGPDGRMYGASFYRGSDATPGDTGLQTFYIIGRPNARLFDCELRQERLEFAGRRAGPGLPNFVQHYFNGLLPSPPAGACDPSGTEVFPNPATEAFRVNVPGACARAYQVRVYDAVGRVVLTRAVAESQSDVPVRIAHLAPGLYLVALAFPERTVVRKLIKL